MMSQTVLVVDISQSYVKVINCTTLREMYLEYNGTGQEKDLQPLEGTLIQVDIEMLKKDRFLLMDFKTLDKQEARIKEYITTQMFHNYVGDTQQAISIQQSQLDKVKTALKQWTKYIKHIPGENDANEESC